MPIAFILLSISPSKAILSTLPRLRSWAIIFSRLLTLLSFHVFSLDDQIALLIIIEVNISKLFDNITSNYIG